MQMFMDWSGICQVPPQLDRINEEVLRGIRLVGHEASCLVDTPNYMYTEML
jgi:hypothetical protein